MIDIPLVNLKRQHLRLRENLLKAFEDTLDSGNFIHGSRVKNFESAFKNFQELNYVVGCANGTVAIEVALRVMGIGQGDEVIIPSHTFIATAEAVSIVGAIPVFADVSQEAHVLTAQTASAVATSKTRAIIPVHIYGYPCPMAELTELANENDWYVIEDCAQAHGAKLSSRTLGSFGHAATFSFYPGKNLGALGDAGIVCFQGPEKTEYARRLINHGRTAKYEHEFLGYNYRMDEVQAAFLLAKLPYLQGWIENRRSSANYYTNVLTENGYSVPKPIMDAEPAYHLYVVEVTNRDQVVSAMNKAGIGCGVHYPIPCHLQKAMAVHHTGKALPVCESIARRTISLPICGEITDQEQEKVIMEFLKVAKPV